jgi:hypothetical protein
LQTDKIQAVLVDELLTPASGMPTRAAQISGPAFVSGDVFMHPHS